MDAKKLRQYLRSQTKVPSELRTMDFEALAARIESTCGKDGIELVARQRDLIEGASCMECKRQAAAARLRIWLSMRKGSE